MLTVIYSNHMAVLAERLAAAIQTDPLPPLQPETVIVQSNELARWLNLRLADRHQIAAHIEFPFPSAWLWSLFRQIWPEVPRESPYAKDALAWKIFSLLPAIRKQAGFEPLDRYLGEQAEPRKVFDLAQRIADSFDQYLMYRPDWIGDWEKGKSPNWQAKLWQRLISGDREPMHRAQLLKQLEQTLRKGVFPKKMLPKRVSIFGLSALPPVYLQLINEIARFTEVDLYFLSPSEAYWGDLVSRKKQAKQQLHSDELSDDSETGHPLLASLGKLGQQFFEQLQGIPHQTEMLYIEPNTDNLLAQLRQDIFLLDPATDKLTVAKTDKSLQIHRCHSPLREAEVLHDQLLNLFNDDPHLAPTDVLVMTPEIDEYAAAIEAVFGSQPASRMIPFSIANRGDAQQQSLISTFMTLLALPDSRFDAETIIGLLECDALQHRFRLDGLALEWIRDWIQQTYIRWGLSGESKEASGFSDNSANTWRAGLDRLMLSYALPPVDEQCWQLFNGQLPLTGIAGDRAPVMAQLHLFIDTLCNWSNGLQHQKSPAQWQHYLSEWLEHWFLPADESAMMQLAILHKTLGKLADSANNAEFSAILERDLIRDWLTQHLDMPDAEHQFMGRGVTVCDMVPMRSIPAKVICLIGMNDTCFPRHEPKPGFDLLSSDFRPGDRSRRDDDRYLFMEAILSADRQLYISYTGASIYDNTDIPPSVLVSDLRDVVNQRFVDVSGKPVWSSLLTSHPLQAFSPRYFVDDEHESLFSFNDAACPPAVTDKPHHDGFAETLPEADLSFRFVSLSQLINFFSHPARYLAEQRLGIYFEKSAALLETREPFELNGLDAWLVKQQLLAGRMQAIDAETIQTVIGASGVLPHGAFADLLLKQQLETVNVFAEQLEPLLPTAPMAPLAFEQDFEPFTVTGQLPGLSATGLLHYRLGKLRVSDLMGFWFSHLLMNCLKPEGVICQSQLLTENELLTLQPVAEAESLLHDLLAMYWQGLHQALPLLPKTSFSYAQVSLNGGRADPDTAAKNAWFGNAYQAGEQDDPYHRLLQKNIMLDDAFTKMALAVYSPIWQALDGSKI